MIVLGPTGSGKTDVAHELARRRGGEIVSADAFAVYRGLDVGTAKPDAARRAEVPYHLIDVADPDESFSAGRWAALARSAVEDIFRRGRLPVVCGGSGFYVSAMLKNLPPAEAGETGTRPALTRWVESRPADARRLLEWNDPVAVSRIHPGNLRYVVRALEILLATGQRPSDRVRGGDAWTRRWRIVKLGLAPDRADLYARIAGRVGWMLEGGFAEEVRRLLERGVSPESNAFRAIGYREVADWVQGRADRAETERKIVAATRQLAKRQKTWSARERDVVWVSPSDALATATSLLDRADAERGRGRR